MCVLCIVTGLQGVPSVFDELPRQALPKINGKMVSEPWLLRSHVCHSTPFLDCGVPFVSPMVTFMLAYLSVDVKFNLLSHLTPSPNVPKLALEFEDLHPHYLLREEEVRVNPKAMLSRRRVRHRRRYRKHRLILLPRCCLPFVERIEDKMHLTTKMEQPLCHTPLGLVLISFVSSCLLSSLFLYVLLSYSSLLNSILPVVSRSF